MIAGNVSAIIRTLDEHGVMLIGKTAGALVRE